MAKYIKLTNEQKDEIRRLTQLANRRIESFHKEYAKLGKEIIPFEVSGGIQTKDQWETKKYALSRSTRFTSEREYYRRLKFLRSFENPVIRQTVTEYTKSQQEKLLNVMDKTISGGLSEVDIEKVRGMSLQGILKFWEKFSEVSRRMGLRYSSDAAMTETLEYFEEDKERLLGR